MTKLSIVVATHGRFGEELLRSAEMIVGKTENVYVLSLLPEMSFDVFMHQANELFLSLTGPVIVLVDLLGGTPANVLTALTKRYPYRVVTGLNLPMFLELYMKTLTTEIDDLVELSQQLCETTKASVVVTNDQLEEQDEQK